MISLLGVIFVLQCTLLLIIYQSLILPYGLAFGASDNNTFDIFISCVFAWDIVIQFNTPIAPLGDESEYITDRRVIANAYARGWYVTAYSCIIDGVYGIS